MAAYHLKMPDVRTTSVVFASPHSGRAYPRRLIRRSVLSELALRSSEDAFVDQLFDTAPLQGAPLLTAVAPRAWIDVNRSLDELDPALIEGVRKSAHNPRVASGLGVVPRVVANGRSIYSGKMPLADAQARLERIWHPYHNKLSGLLEETYRQFGICILLDCHSMPHEAMDSLAGVAPRRPEVVIGDRFGASARGEIVDRIEAAFTAVGLSVVRNTPFAGAYVAQHYGRPAKGRHAVQIEIDRSLYMNEQLIRPNGNFESFRRLIRSVVADLTEIGRPAERPLAAE